MATESGLEGAALSGAAGAEDVVVVDLAAAPAAVTARDRAVARRLGRVRDALEDDPHSFGFFQAVRLLERLFPERAPVGAPEPEREVVRFAVNPALGFPASEIQQLAIAGDTARMVVNFMGLVGPQGVLPHQYSLLVSERLRARDSALADFLDMFQHRMLALFYQAWRRHRFTIAHEDGTRDSLAERLRDIAGIGLDTTRERLPFPDEALIFRTGLLTARARGAVGLEQLLIDFFGVPAEVEQFVGGWYRLERGDWCVVDDDGEDGAQLGVSAVVGEEIWDQQARVRVRLGPLPRREYDTFLPGRSGHAALASLLRFFSHDAVDFEVQLVLAAAEVPPVELGTDEPGTQQLGWSTWIRSAPRQRDADETVLTLQQQAVAS